MRRLTATLLAGAMMIAPVLTPAVAHADTPAKAVAASVGSMFT